VEHLYEKIRRQDVREDHFIREALETATIQFAARHLTRKDKENLSEILDKQQICVDPMRVKNSTN